LIAQNFYLFYFAAVKMPSDKIVLCKPHLSRQAGTHNKGKRLSYLMPTRHPKKDGINFIAIKKEKAKAVTLSTLLPYVFDSYLLSYGRPGT
jgi:hypothetical protein